MDSKQIGARMRSSRLALGLTQEDLSARAGVNFTLINRYENGHILPSVENLIAIAEALSVSIDYLVAATDDPKGRVAELSPAEQRLITNARRRNVPAMLREVIALSDGEGKPVVAGGEEAIGDEKGSISGE